MALIKKKLRKKLQQKVLKLLFQHGEQLVTALLSGALSTLTGAKKSHPPKSTRKAAAKA